MTSGGLNRKAKKTLMDYKRSINPLILKEQVETNLRKIWALVQKLDKKEMSKWEQTG